MGGTAEALEAEWSRTREERLAEAKRQRDARAKRRPTRRQSKPQPPGPPSAKPKRLWMPPRLRRRRPTRPSGMPPPRGTALGPPQTRLVGRLRSVLTVSATTAAATRRRPPPLTSTSGA